MQKDFVIDEKKLKQLASDFNISKDSCRKLFELYKDVVSKKIRTQYLAHIIRSMELEMRRITGNGLFVIKCMPMEKSTVREAVGKYHENRFFIIYFNSSLPEEKKRIVLAHELGHLFLVAIAVHQWDKGSLKKYYGEGHYMEPLASLFGIFIIAAKNDFYQKEAIKYVKNVTWKGLVDDFLGLRK
jgi:Zn-dependent peptidase ImmA (M78 family)